VYDLFSLYYKNKDRMPNNHTIIQGILNVERDCPGLKQKLDNNHGISIRNHTAGELLTPKETGNVRLQQIDQIRSHVAVIYRLLTFFPDWFPGHSVTGLATIWGHTHDTWQAAFYVYQYFKERRTKKTPG
jgi:hypothetical protein